MSIALLSWSLALLAITGLTSFSGIVSATDIRITGFGTIGYARASEHDLRYLRYIDNDGSFKADSIVGVQAEAQFNAQWGATVQAVASAPRTKDDGYEAKIRWAFISFRPDNDWLFRFGRVRPPVFHNSQNAEVGVTHDYARLPTEVYSLSPIYDFDGLAAGRSWTITPGEISLDAYGGRSDSALRFFLRDLNQAVHVPAKIESKGIVMSFASQQFLLRGGIHRATIELVGQQFVETFLPAFPFSPAPEPFGGPIFFPSNFLPALDVTVRVLGADYRLGHWRIAGEYGERDIPQSQGGGGSKSGYVSLSRKMSGWTPYATYARLLTESSTRNLYQLINSTSVPLLAQGPPLSLPSTYHRLLVDQGLVYDQRSIMLGASYSLTANSKLKFEWMRTHVGLRSTLVDGDFSNKAFRVISMSYSVVF